MSIVTAEKEYSRVLEEFRREELGRTPRNFAFCGLAGSGKDTAGSAVIESSLRYRRISFADPIRDMIGVLGIDVKKIYDEGTKNSPIADMGGKSLRHMMQSLGTEWGRDLIHPDIWLNVSKRRIKKANHDGFGVILTDCRFDNEAEELKNLGFKIIRIEMMSFGKKDEHAHKSENGISDSLIDKTVYNRVYDNTQLGLIMFKINVISSIVKL